MTTHQCTPSFVLLDHEDIDGLIDIARYGLPLLANNPATIGLVERLANTIVTYATGQQIRREGYNPNQLESDEAPPELIGGMAVFQVWPVDGMDNNSDD